MLQAHSILWHYLWVAPNVLFILLGILLWRRGVARTFPAFIAFAILGSLGDLATYLADISPSVTPENYWRILWAGLIVESLLKFLVIGEVLSQVLAPYPSIARLGKKLVSGCGTFLVFLAAVIAAFARGDSKFGVVRGAHLLELTVFIIELGLIIFLFLFAAYFHLSWDRLSFGILLGLGISACQHLAAWAIIANANPSEHVRTLLAFVGMATYHLCVFIWGYYLLVPGKVSVKPRISLPENNLAVWNRELERLLQQ